MASTQAFNFAFTRQFYNVRRMEKLQGMHTQDAVLLESFGWAPGSIWWQRKMKVSRGKKKKNQESSSYNLPVPASWECCRRTGNVHSCSRVLVSFDCIRNSFFGSTLLHLPYVMRSHPVHSKTGKCRSPVAGLIVQLLWGFSGV